MNRDEKKVVVDELKEKFSNSNFFYLTDASSMSVLEINNLRRVCFSEGVEMRVAKNTLIKRAMDACDTDFEGLYGILKGPTFLMFSPVSNAPAKIIKKIRKKGDRPLVKGAFIDSDVFIGDDQLDTLFNLKSKEELIGDVISLLQSPMKNVISALQSGRDTLAGLIKTMADQPDTTVAKEEKPAEAKEVEKEDAKEEKPVEAKEGDKEEAKKEEAPKEEEGKEEEAKGSADEEIVESKEEVSTEKEENKESDEVAGDEIKEETAKTEETPEAETAEEVTDKTDDAATEDKEKEEKEEKEEGEEGTEEDGKDDEKESK